MEIKKILRNPLTYVIGIAALSHTAYLTDKGKDFWNLLYSTIWDVLKSILFVKVSLYGWILILFVIGLITSIFAFRKSEKKKSNKITELVNSNKELKSEIEASKIDIVEGKRDVDGIRWKYRANRATGDWISLSPHCPNCGMQLCVEDVSGEFAITPSQYRVQYYCDNQDCGQFSEVFQGTSDDIESKAIRHINLHKKIN